MVYERPLTPFVVNTSSSVTSFYFNDANVSAFTDGPATTGTRKARCTRCGETVNYGTNLLTDNSMVKHNQDKVCWCVHNL